jgi:adenylate cyclase
MFTDVVGYTRLTQSNESLALELLEEQKSLLRPIISKNGGKEIKTIGDAFLVEFRSALEAVICAVDIQKKLQERNAKTPASRKLELRVGIHLGDVIHNLDDVFGDAVNVASRIEPLSDPGGICISQQVYDHVRNKTELSFGKLGEKELKNVELPVGIYKINLQQGRQESPSPISRNRLAVLPFVNISPDPNDEYFADGLTEELIAKLSEIKGLKVIARTSIMNYKHKEKNASEIGKELSVGSIIEGSVRKVSNKIRVTVQLIDAQTEEHLWASNYDKELDDVFAIQSDVSSKVARTLSTEFFKSQKSDTDNVEAYSLYLRAVQLIHEDTETSLREAISLLNKAILKDPGFVRAYAQLSQAWTRLALTGFESYSVVTEKAEPAARKALELGPEMADSHAAMANIHGILDRFDKSVYESEKAVEINPNLAEAQIELGILYSTIGNLKHGLKAFQRAYEIDPLSIRAGYYLALVAGVVGDDQLALSVLEKLRELNPKNSRVYGYLAQYHLLKFNFIEAQKMLDLGLAINPKEPSVLLNQGTLYALTGRKSEALAIVQNLSLIDTAREYGNLFIQAALGNIDLAFQTLMKMAENHTWPFLIKTLPIFESLRKDPRFQEFCHKVGLGSESWNPQK